MTVVTSCYRSLIAYSKGSRIAYNRVSYDSIRTKINTNPIVILFKANKNSQIVSTCCRVAVTALSAAKHRGNNQVRSLEVSPLSFNPCETSCTAPEEMNNHSTSASTLAQGSCVKITHQQPSRLLHEQPWTQQEQKGKKRKEEKNDKMRDQQFRVGHALLDRDKLDFVIVVRMRDWRCQQSRLFIFAAGSKQIET